MSPALPTNVSGTADANANASASASASANADAGPGPSTQHNATPSVAADPTGSSNSASGPDQNNVAAAAAAPAPAGKPELPWAFIDCPTDTLVELISHMLNLLMQHNDQVVLTPDALTRFHSRAAPGISVVDYLRRIVKYTNMEKIPLLSLLAYIDLTCSHLPTFTLSTLTVHRFLIAGVCAGSKAQCDVFCTNAHYAKVGGIKVQELNALEREFLRVTQWALCCNADLLQRYYTSLIRSHGGFTQAPSPTQSPFRPFPRSLSKPRAPVQEDVDVEEEYEGQAYGPSEDGTAEGDGEGDGEDDVAEDDAMEGTDVGRGRKQRRKSVEEVLGVVAETSEASVNAGPGVAVQANGEAGGGMEVDGEGVGDVRVTVEDHGAGAARDMVAPNGTLHSAQSSASASSPNAFLRPNVSQTSMASPSAQTTSSYISASTSASASSSPRRARDGQAYGAAGADASSPTSSSVPSSSRSSVRGRSRGVNGANGLSPAISHRRRGSSISVASASSASSRGSRGRSVGGSGSGRGRAPSLSYSISSAPGRPAEAVLDMRAAASASASASPREAQADGRVRTPEIVGKRYPLEPAGAMAAPEGSARGEERVGEGLRSRTVSGSSARTEVPPASASHAHVHGHGPGGGRLLKNLVGVFRKRVPSGSGTERAAGWASAPHPHPADTESAAQYSTSPRTISALSQTHDTADANNANASAVYVSGNGNGNGNGRSQTDTSGRPLKSPRLTQSSSASRDVRMSLSLSPTTFVGGHAPGQGDAGYMPPPSRVGMGLGAHAEEGGQSPRSPFVGSTGSVPAGGVSSTQGGGAGCGAAAAAAAAAGGHGHGHGHGHSHVTPRIRRREQSGDGLAV